MYPLSIAGRQFWNDLFFNEDHYIYKATDGSTTVVSVVKLINKKKVLKQDLDFWKSLSEHVGGEGMPDFYTLKVWIDLDDL